jgi:hypothetical protein
MDEDIKKEMRDHAWSYFVLHAEQRLKTFHFYLILATLIAGGVVTLAKSEENCFKGAAAISLLLPFLSFIFWKLDQRNKQLVKHAEEALKLIESESKLNDTGKEPHRLKLFLHENYFTSKRPRLPYWPPWQAHFSYSTCFNAVFLVFGVFGFVGGIILLFA